MVKLVASVLVVAPLPKLQNRFVIVPVEASRKVTVRGGVPLVGEPVNEAKGGARVPQQVREIIATESRNQPLSATLASAPQSHLNCTDCPVAEGGRLTRVVTNPPEAPVHACLRESGLAELFRARG